MIGKQKATIARSAAHESLREVGTTLLASHNSVVQLAGRISLLEPHRLIKFPLLNTLRETTVWSFDHSYDRPLDEAPTVMQSVQRSLRFNPLSRDLALSVLFTDHAVAHAAELLFTYDQSRGGYFSQRRGAIDDGTALMAEGAEVARASAILTNIDMGFLTIQQDKG